MKFKDLPKLGGQGLAGRVADWLMSNPVVIAVLVVLVTMTFAAIV